MKKILLVIIGALALILSATSVVRAETFPNRLVSGVLPSSGVLNVSTDGANLSLELCGFQEGSFVMEFFTQAGSGTVSLYSIVTDDIVTPPTITRGTFSTPAGQYDTKVLFQISNRVPGRYTSGTVTLSCTTPWTFPGKTDVVLIKINATGPTGTDSCWVAAYRPPTAAEVTRFDLSERVSYLTNVTRKLVSGKLVLTTNITVSVTTTYGVGIGVATDDVVGFSIQEEWRTIFSGPFWTDRVAILYTPGLLTSGSFVPQSFRTGNYRLVAISSDGSTEVVATANSLGAPPPNTN